MPIENVTPNRGYQLPNAANDLVDDVARLIAAVTGIDLDVATILAALLTKSDVGHEHVIGDITGLGAALATLQALDQKGQANGYAALGSDGKVPAAQLPAVLFGAMSYQGTWNASTNNPVIPAATATNKGHYYKVSVAGTTTISGVNDWEIGDWVVSNGVSWDKIDNTDQVLSVAGLRGAISAVALKAALAIAIGDVGGLQDALDAKAATSALAEVATSGSYGDLSDTPEVSRPANKRIYLSSATWTKPEGLTKVVVTCLGGGGGSGGTTRASDYRGGGGAGGTMAVSTIMASSLGSTEPITVGAGGSAGSSAGGAGGAGGNSSFGSHCIGNGGGGGGGSQSNTIGAGGTPGSGTGDLVIRGMKGAGGGDVGYFGLYGASPICPPRGDQSAPLPNANTGLGAIITGANGAGLPGMSGLVIIEEYF